MNWYKKYIYAGHESNISDLIYKLELFGVEAQSKKRGATSHVQFVNTNNGKLYHISNKGTGTTIPAGTIQLLCKALDIPWSIFKKISKKPKKREVDRIEHLLPWNQGREQIEKVPEEQTWEKKYNLQLEKAKEEARLKEKEEDRWLIEEIRKEELAKLKPIMGSDKMNWYKKANKWRDKIPGGRADEKKPSDYEKSQVEKGKKIEYEHTNDPAKAKEISMDHLKEHPEYYSEKKGLPAMERNLEKTKPARRGRYQGQLQGDENRPDSSVITDIFDDNDVVEGEFVKVLRRMAGSGDWDSFNNYLQKLRNDGHSQARVNSMMSRAMHGVKL